MDAVIVEVLNRFGQVRSRHRLATFPATLGRALTNDVILDEADVSALHAKVVRSADGLLTLEDTSSANGIRVAKKRVASVALGPRTDVRLASAHVRFVSLDAPVLKTSLFRVSRLDRWQAPAAAAVFFVLSGLIDEWYLKATRVRASEVLETLAMVGVMLAGGWAFAWSLASRVAHGRSKVLGHLAAALIACGALSLLAIAMPYLASLLRLGSIATDVLIGAPMIFTLAWLLFQNLSRVVSWSRRRLIVTIGSLSVVGSALVVVVQAAKASKYSAQLPMAGSHLPPAFLVGPVASDPALGDRIAALQREVDALKREP